MLVFKLKCIKNSKKTTLHNFSPKSNTKFRQSKNSLTSCYCSHLNRHPRFQLFFIFCITNYSIFHLNMAADYGTSNHTGFILISSILNLQCWSQSSRYHNCWFVGLSSTVCPLCTYSVPNLPLTLSCACRGWIISFPSPCDWLLATAR